MQRSCAAIVQGGKVTLIERKRDGSLYYLFPGGGVEEGETPEEAPMLLSFRNPVVISSRRREISLLGFIGLGEKERSRTTTSPSG